MKKMLLQFGLLGIMFAAVIVGFSTNHPTKKASPAVYSFYYYPKANIYYNRISQEYAFVNPEGNWQTSKNLPYVFSLDEKKVELTDRSPAIWKNNEQHRMVYAVSLYASASDLKEPPLKAEFIPPPAVRESTEKKVEEKKEPGLKRFFKKIFRKKKDNQEKSVQE